MVEEFILKIRRGESPFFSALKKLYRAYNTGHFPVPGFLKPFFAGLYRLHFFLFWVVLRRMATLLYREPLFRSRCAHVGERLYLESMPEALEHTIIYIGDDVQVHGKIGIYSGRVFDAPTLRIGSRVSIGDRSTFSCNREITIEDDVLISARCSFADNDGHPLDAQSRAAGNPPPAERTRPVRICRYAWIGAGAYILKGVTVGEGAIVAAGSIVSSDVPPYTVVAGNPARVVKELRAVQAS